MAYHGVPDPEALDLHLQWICSEFTVLSGTDVVHHLRRRQPFPKRTMWLTFDDGLASVVRNGLPVLESYGVPATIFVSPGLVEESLLPWWSEIACAIKNGWDPPTDETGDELVRSLKRVPDSVRRDIVGQARAANLRHGSYIGSEVDVVATRDEIADWLASGREVGNHTWDHPCLQRCAPDAQARQIIEAGAWLEEFGAFESSRLFAYPNGDWTPETDAVLREEGYDIALLFDHRVARWASDPLQMSRLRLDSSSPIERVRAVLSGGHSVFVGRQGPSGGDVRFLR